MSDPEVDPSVEDDPLAEEAIPADLTGEPDASPDAGIDDEGADIGRGAD